MTERSGAARVRELADAERSWREGRPEWALRIAVLDLVTSCGLQYYADHAVDDDLDLVERVVALRGDATQRRSGSEMESLGLRCVDELRDALPAARPSPGELDAVDDVRRIVTTVPALVVLGRDDEAASADLVCWNETRGLVEGVSSPWRCAATLAALAHLRGPHRDPAPAGWTDVRDRYVALPERHPELDDQVGAMARELLEQLTGA